MSSSTEESEERQEGSGDQRDHPHGKASKEGGWLNKIALILQVIFFITVSAGTIFNGWQLLKQSKLVNKPVIGITNVKTIRVLKKGVKDKNSKNVDDMEGVIVQYSIENVGNLPAKNYKIKNRAKLGDKILSQEDRYSADYSGSIFTKGLQYGATVRLLGNNFKEFVYKEMPLTNTIEISYTDWEKYESYNYTMKFNIKLVSKNPFTLSIYPSE